MITSNACDAPAGSSSRAVQAGRRMPGGLKGRLARRSVLGVRCDAARDRPPTLQPQPQQQPQAQQQQHADSTRLAAAATSALAAAGLGMAVWLGPAGMQPALAQPKMTPDETLTISVFKKATPSVVNVTNLTARCVWLARTSKGGGQPGRVRSTRRVHHRQWLRPAHGGHCPNVPARRDEHCACPHARA